jgi:hypothetical protein
MKRACKVAQLSASMPPLLNPQDTDRPPLQAGHRLAFGAVMTWHEDLHPLSFVHA